MTIDDFQKPENASALEKTLARCGMVLPNDARAANCRAAMSAKFAIQAAEIGRIRRDQVAKRELEEDLAGEGVTIVEKTQKPSPATAKNDQRVPSDVKVAERDVVAR